MTSNNRRKKRIRAYMAEHGVNYTIAMRAVAARSAELAGQLPPDAEDNRPDGRPESVANHDTAAGQEAETGRESTPDHDRLSPVFRQPRQ